MIDQFGGPYRFLSNFADCTVHLDGVMYPSAEHAYQAAKTADIGDRQAIAALDSPGQAKRAGKRVDLRPDWELAKKRVMLLVVLAKFIQNPDLGRALIATGDEVLVEGNSWGDDYWGAVAYIGQEDRWETQLPIWQTNDPHIILAGRNWLGRILMTVRDVLTPD